MINPSQFQKGKRVCSWACRLAEKDDLKNRVCSVCGKQFRVAHPSSKNQTCSSKCGHDLRKRGEFRPCEECGKKMWVWPVYYETKRFCSRECLGKWHSKTLVRERSSNWNGGASFFPYPYEWNDKLKAKIRQRDGEVCQECGTSEYLSVHHIDYDKSNCSEMNLITLCNPCNARANFSRSVWQEKYSSMIVSIYNNST
jgi:hypothetical protein